MTLRGHMANAIECVQACTQPELPEKLRNLIVLQSLRDLDAVRAVLFTE